MDEWTQGLMAGLVAALVGIVLAGVARADEGPTQPAPTTEQVEQAKAEAARWQAIAQQFRKIASECLDARAMEAANAAGGQAK